VTTAESLAGFPDTIGEWRARDVPLDPEVIKAAAVDDFLNRQYSSAQGNLGLYVGYYQNQRQGESLHSPLFCLPGSGWQPVQTGDVSLPTEPPSPVVKELVVERSGSRLLVLYWYQTVKRVTGSEYGRKLFLMSDALVSRRTDVALVRIIAPIDSRDRQGAVHALGVARPFAARIQPEIQARLFRN
jgi:EpsI family protein